MTASRGVGSGTACKKLGTLIAFATACMPARLSAAPFPFNPQPLLRITKVKAAVAHATITAVITLMTRPCLAKKPTLGAPITHRCWAMLKHSCCEHPQPYSTLKSPIGICTVQPHILEPTLFAILSLEILFMVKRTYLCIARISTLLTSPHW